MAGLDAFKDLADRDAPLWSPNQPKSPARKRGLAALVDTDAPTIDLRSQAVADDVVDDSVPTAPSAKAQPDSGPTIPPVVPAGEELRSSPPTPVTPVPAPIPASEAGAVVSDRAGAAVVDHPAVLPLPEGHEPAVVLDEGAAAKPKAESGIRQVNARLSPKELHIRLREAATQGNLYYDQLLVLAMERHGDQVVQQLLTTHGVARRRKGVWSEPTPFRLRPEDAARLDELCARLPAEVSLSRVVTALLAALLLTDEPLNLPTT